MIGTGRVSFVTGRTERIAALNAIMSHYTDRADWEFSERALAAVCIFRLEADKLSCKEHR